MAAITTFNAHEMAQRSVEARKAYRQRALEAEAIAKELVAKLDQTPLSAKQRRIEAQLQRLDDLLDESEDYKEINALTQAKERLMGIWCRLTGFPREGVRKQSKSRSTLPDVQPLSPDPVSPVQPNNPQEPNG